MGVGMNNYQDIGTEKAAADLSAKQYYGVKFTSTGVNLVTGPTEICDGILQNDPESGYVANVRPYGVTIITAGAALAKGANFSISAAGKAVAPTAGDNIYGKLLEAAGADGDKVTALFGFDGVEPTP